MNCFVNDRLRSGCGWWSQRLLVALLVYICMFPALVHGQAFTEMTSLSDSIRSLYTSAAAWGDYDNDGDLDLLISGYDGGQSTLLYRNDGSVFTQVQAGLIGLTYSALDWIDFDTDGDLDILVTGTDGMYDQQTLIYRNDGGQFISIGAGLPILNQGAVDCGDFDNDGDQDIVLAGWDSLHHVITKVFRNDFGAFTDIGAGLLGASEEPGLAWGDYDGDGDLDLAVVGADSAAGLFSKIYRNDAGQFTDIGATMTGLMKASVAWGDYDNDGDLDLVVAGGDWAFLGRTYLYRNDGGLFVDAQAGLEGLLYSSVGWGDFENDGDLDLLITGTTGLNTLTIVYRNDPGTFVDMGAGLANVYFGDGKWGDYDNDGDLDVAVLGWDASLLFAKIYRNNTLVPNLPPTAPGNFVGTVSGNGTAIDFTWAPAADDHTPVDALSYRVWAGASANVYGISSPYADPSSGLRRVAEFGLIQDTTWTLRQLTPGQTYFACVSAIDGGMMGSPCSNQVSVMMVTGRAEGSLQTVVAGPNPTGGRIKLELPLLGGSVVDWMLLDLEGRMVAGMNGRAQGVFELDLSGLAAGVYWLQLESAGLAKPALLKVIKE